MTHPAPDSSWCNQLPSQTTASPENKVQNEISRRIFLLECTSTITTCRNNKRLPKGSHRAVQFPSHQRHYQSCGLMSSDEHQDSDWSLQHLRFTSRAYNQGRLPSAVQPAVLRSNRPTRVRLALLHFTFSGFSPRIEYHGVQPVQSH